MLIGERYRELLVDLLRIDTTTPMETKRASRAREAQELFAQAAHRIGMTTVLHEPAPPSALDARWVPQSVRDVRREMGDAFLENQPNLVLRLGPPRAAASTLMFNFHIDTVASGHGEVTVDGRTIRACGAADCKGPGVALLAAIEHACVRDRSLLDDISILVQCVSGEEGGAMGVYGTRHLVTAGHVGRLNVFAEPSGGVYFDHATTAMTLRIDVTGEGAIDDTPEAGVNATVLLGHLATVMATEISTWTRDQGARACIAGIHTGRLHNRVYGSGELHVNFAYDSPETASRIEAKVEDVLARALDDFALRFGGVGDLQRTIAALPDAVRAVWTKRGLPVLANRDAAMESMLAEIGMRRCPEEEKDRAFTCDAIWSPPYTIVFGPGDLAKNRAHAEGEFVTLDEIEEYAEKIVRLVVAFRRLVKEAA